MMNLLINSVLVLAVTAAWSLLARESFRQFLARLCFVSLFTSLGYWLMGRLG